MSLTRMRTGIAVGCLAVTMVIGASAALAEERPMARQPRPQGWWTRENVQTELGLSTAQIQSISAIEEQHREATLEIRKEQQKAYRGMIKLLTVGRPTEQEIAEGRKALEEAWTASVELSVEHWVKLRAELTSTQWEKLPQVAPRSLQLGGIRIHAMGTVRVGEEGAR